MGGLHGHSGNFRRCSSAKRHLQVILQEPCHLYSQYYKLFPSLKISGERIESLSCTCTHRGAFFPLLYIFSNMAQAAHFAPASHRLCIVAQHSELAATGAAAFLCR